MKWLIGIVVCLFLTVQVSAEAAEIGLAWDSNPESNIAGYRIYQSINSGSYPDTWVKEISHVWNVDTQSVLLQDVPDGEWHWVATAYNTEGQESGHSNEVSTTVGELPPLDTTPPAIPSGFSIENIVPIPVSLNSLVHNTFEAGDEGWAGAQTNTSYERSTVAYVGQYSMRVFNPTGPGGKLSIDINPAGWNVDVYPFVRFAYKIPQGVPVGLFFDVTGGVWACLGGTASHNHEAYLADDKYVLIDDNIWHVITIDARDLRGLQTVDSIYEFEWFTGSNSQMGDEFWFDEFIILAEE